MIKRVMVELVPNQRVPFGDPFFGEISARIHSRSAPLPGIEPCIHEKCP